SRFEVIGNAAQEPVPVRRKALGGLVISTPPSGREPHLARATGTGCGFSLLAANLARGEQLAERDVDLVDRRITPKVVDDGCAICSSDTGVAQHAKDGIGKRIAGSLSKHVAR